MLNLSIRRRHWRLLTHWKRPDAGKDWRQEKKGTTEMRGWMASPTQWTWVWVDSRSWWWTGRPGLLQFKESQRVGHDWVTELYWTEYNWSWILPPYQDPKFNLRDSFGWIRKESLYCSAEWKGVMPSRLNPNLERAVRSFTVMVGRGSDWLVDASHLVFVR